MTGNAAIRVPGVAVVGLAIEHVLSPAIPGRRVSPIPIAERGIVHHVPLVAVALLRRREIDESMLLRQERRCAQTKWHVKRLGEIAVERTARDVLDDVTEQHESEIAVVSRLADAPLQWHVPYDVVRLPRRRRMVVEWLPLHQSRRMLEQMPNGDAVEVNTTKVG